MSKRNELIEQHYRENYSRLVKKMVWRVPHRSLALAEEVVQEAYERSIRYYRTFNPTIKHFDTWFNTILNNTLKGFKKIESNGGVVYEFDENLDEIVPPRNVSTYYELISQLDGASNIEKEILNLFFILGFKSREVALYVNKSHTNVRQIILRFRNRTKDAIHS